MSTSKPSLKQQLSKQRQEAITAYQNDPKPERLLKALARHVDAALMQAWRDTGIPAGNTLIAVGGYGRGELFPYSDVDVLILLQRSPDEALQKKLESFIQTIWNLGLQIGHSVRTIEECLHASANDITIQTSLLEARLVTGSRDLFRQLVKRYDIAMNARDFFLAKTLETRQRHQKLGDTPFSLEPNCKESPGGLRDLQVILWVAKAAGFGNSWEELARRELITRTEAGQLRKTERTLKNIRIRLHIQTQRAEDRILFDVQIPLAEAFHFKKAKKPLDARDASEYLMQHYYLAARIVRQLNIILLQNLEARLFPQTHEPESINERFNKVSDFIDIATEDTFTKHPSSLLEVFLLLAERSDLKNMTARTLRALWHARVHINKKFNQDPENHSLFLRILQAPRFSARALQHMNELGILGRYLPNFGKIIGQMQHDLFHQYTVDQHILIVIGNLHRFTLTEYAHEYPFCSQLIANFSRPWLLYIAALFHDIAKGRGGDHSLLGMADARQFCQSHGLSEEDTELIVFLVEHHLTMSHIAQKRDLSDPAVIREFTDLIKNERRLTALYLLTVADIRGTNPQIWNAWKSKLLEDLYYMSLRVLGGEVLSVDHELAQRQQEALATLRLYGLPEHAHETLWKHLDVGYFLRHDASDIAWQTRMLYYRTDTIEPVVKCRLSPIGEGLQVTVYTRDEPDLFLQICGYFSRRNFSILDAKIHTTNHGYALDTFLVTEQTFSRNYRDIINLVEHNLTEALKADAPLLEPSIGRLSRKSRSFPITPGIDLRPDASGDLFVLSLIANDRNGLLYAIAEVLRRYHINLHTAKIMTLGERVEDVFLVGGDFLKNPKNQIQLETDLLEVLRI
ncbi:[protein-PII] uridylyltransferase [Oxalobacter vibrioformis]|uniref:Bifunctional uridylyltransferase/uridylyl-removing enzyme n=1 Tax=Oxalobacter vibrioformis TaxID=933080 RepID=A0A9E9LZY6_9BURK|nr:[protein-PII] uridylyltransferase [Oxalobacter vibrioformis]WAW10612.1 [protein-PII] uridylyltransferase [Oxalobacter vibrioformis]